MNYTEFNNWVYNYYLEFLIPDEINSLTIPKGEIDFLVQTKNLLVNGFKEINEKNWSELLVANSNGVPKFFGLVALQCAAAFMMQNDGVNSAGNFRSRFINLVGIESDSKLTSLFSEEIKNKINIQEFIWSRINAFFEEKNIKIVIPSKKSYAGRNTQYPLSQSVLNYEDLKEFRFFYEYIDEEYDVMHYDDFLSEYQQNILRFSQGFNRYNNNRFLSEAEQKIKLKQIFDYYTSQKWRENTLNKKLNNTAETFYLKLEETFFNIYNEEFEIVDNTSVVFDKNKFVFFQEDEVYKNEFNIVRKISLGSRYIILLKDIKENEYLKKNLEQNSLCTKIGDDNIHSLSYLLNFKDEIPEFLNHFKGHNYPIKLIGNKVSRKRQYFFIAPPKIFSRNNELFSLYHNSNRVLTDQPFEIGQYIIKVNGFSNYSFEILGTPTVKFSLPNLNYKLNLQNLKREINEHGDMTGFCITTKENDIKENLSIRSWIQANSVKSNRSNNIIIKAINQFKYGKDK